MKGSGEKGVIRPGAKWGHVVHVRYITPMQFPIMTKALATRIEHALMLAAVSRVAHVQLLPSNPLGIEMRRWGRVEATLVRRDAYYYPHFNATRGVGQGREEAFDEALAWVRSND